MARSNTGKTANSGKRSGAKSSASKSASKRSGSGAKRQTTGAARKGSRKTKAQMQQEQLMSDEVAVICTVAVAVFLFLSNLGMCGPIGEVLKTVQLGLFGSVGYVFPLALVLAVMFILSNRGTKNTTDATLKTTAALVSLVFVSGLVQLTAGGGANFEGLMAYYRQAAETGIGGGIVGGALSQLLFSLTGQVGAVLILLAALFVCLVYTTGKPLARMIGGWVAQESIRTAGKAKDGVNVAAERAKAYAAERRRQREEQLALGVNLDATDLSAAACDDMGAVEYDDAEADWADDAFEASDAELCDAAEGPEYAEAAASADPSRVFSGRILNSDAPYDYDADDSVPFDVEDIYIPGDLFDELEADEASAEAVITEDDAALYETEAASRAADENDAYARTLLEEAGAELSEDTARKVDGSAFELPKKQTAQISYDAVEAEDEIDPAAVLAAPDAAQAKAMHAQGRDMFGQAAGTRRVVTASGRVIESDQEDLRKRVEQKRVEAATELDNAAVQAEIAKKVKKKPYRFPSVELLKRGGRQGGYSDAEIKETAIKLQTTLKSFGVGVTVTDVSVGPTVTRYELHPEQGVKVSRIVALADDIKLSLAAADIRIEAPIPGKSAVGIEVPNKENVMVYLGDVLGSKEFRDAESRLSFGVGKDIGGQTVVTDLAKMPHLLIAGSTGSGKSVCINTLIMSLIYKASPEEVRLIMIDPKVVELQIYNGIPHLLIPVVTEPKKASAALNWAVAEMTERYKKFAETGVRDLKGYNKRVEQVRRDPSIEEEKKPEKLPQIVIIVDELADLMMVAPGEVEDAICRLAQLARAAGIHLVIATQRPSVNVITGLIKANVPSRIAFAVSSGVDSRTIIDMVGAEKLLGKGDMLFYPSGIPKPVRVQGAFVSDAEVQAVVDFLTEQGTAEYSEEVQKQVSQPQAGGGAGGQSDRDGLFYEAGVFIIESDKASVSMLQRKFRIGFNRAARIMDQLAEAQVVGPEEGTKPRRILMSKEAFDEI